jgi:hypothetical protein
MTPNVWVAFWLGIVLGVNGGVLIAAILAANARQAACEDAYTKGFFRGLKTARENVVHDIIAADTATTGADRRPAA